MVITHGIVVNSFAHFMDEKSESRYPIPINKWTDYTAIAAAKINDKSVKLTLGSDASHLKGQAAQWHLMKK